MDNTGTSEGLHTVEVQATGSSTRSDTISIYVASSNQAPVADSQIVSTNEDTDVGILLTAYDPDGDPLTYQILSQPYSGTLTGTPPNLIYSPFADYNGGDNFKFNVFDGSTYSNEASVAITVEPVNDAPVASFSYITDGLQVNFTNNSSDIDGNIVSYSWNFGDGSSSSSVNPSHQYASSGTYSVTLEVTDNDGAKHDSTQVVTVGTPVQINTPTNLTADLNGNNVTLSWNDTSEGEEGFIIERAQKIKGKYNFDIIGTEVGDTPVYVDEDVSPASYKYRVKAYKDSIQSDYSNEVSVTVEAVASYCGDGTCDGNETSCSCPVDCGDPDSYESDCSDGIDNDCDGLTDCDDEDCSGDSNCTGACLPKKAACSSDDECCSGDCLPNATCK
jgi:PKD repeat protein